MLGQRYVRAFIAATSQGRETEEQGMCSLARNIAGIFFYLYARTRHGLHIMPTAGCRGGDTFSPLPFPVLGRVLDAAALVRRSFIGTGDRLRLFGKDRIGIGGRIFSSRGNLKCM